MYKYFFLLKQRFFNINQQNEEGNTALSFACLFGHDEIVELLIKDNCIDTKKTNNYDITALINACLLGHTETIKIL